MSNPAEYSQKHFATKISFGFDRNELNYKIQDNSGAREFAIEAGEISVGSRIEHDRNSWLRNVGLIWCGLGVLNIALAMVGERALAGSAFWLLVGAVCLAFYRFTWASYTVHDTREGPLYILHDKQLTEIEREIEVRRKQDLLEWYTGLDLENAPEEERRILEMLVKNRALTREEADARLSSLSQATISLPTPDTAKKPNLH